VGGEELNPPVTDPVNTALHPRAMLAMLTYCYADGVYGSQDAEMMMHEDTAFRALCGIDYPDWQRLRRFRRHNHGALRRTLSETFHRAWGLKCIGTTPTDRADWCRLPTGTTRAMTPMNEARLEQEIEERIERAMFIDRMSDDY